MKELKLLKEIVYKERYKYCKDTFGCSPDTASLWLKVITQNPSKTLLNATLEELNLLLEFSSLDVHERKSKTYSAGEANGIKNYGDTRIYNKKTS